MQRGDGDAAVGGLEAVETAVVAWDADGAAAVGAEGEGDEARGDRVGRTA